MLVRLQPAQLEALDAWITKQSRPLTRPEAIRAMMDTILARPMLPSTSSASPDAMVPR